MLWIIAVTIILCGGFYIGQEKMATQKVVSGKVVIPMVDLAQKNNSILVRVENDQSKTFSFRFDYEEFNKLIDLTKEFELGQSPAIITVEFKISLFGKVSDVKVVDFKPGWVRRPK